MLKVPMIGILAGMGPKSTAPFIDQLISTFQRLTDAKYDIDFPHVMIYSLPTPFYIDRPIDHALMQKTIILGLQKLEQCGVSFIAMPSNIAHIYFPELQNSISIPLLNIVTATFAKLPPSIERFAILGTRLTLESGIYQKGLAEMHLTPQEHLPWQQQVDALILSIKSSAPLQQSLKLWEALAHTLKSAHIDTIILACTDLNVIEQSISASFQVVDSSRCLAEAIVQKWQMV